MDDDEYPPERDLKNDSEFTYYGTKAALYDNGPLEQHKNLAATKGAVRAIAIDDARNPGRLDAYHMPPDGPRYA